jgi:hypothetical protein
MGNCTVGLSVSRQRSGEAAMQRSIEVAFCREGNRRLAQALNVDVATFDTPDEARAAIKEALELYFEDEPDQAPRAVRDA